MYQLQTKDRLLLGVLQEQKYEIQNNIQDIKGNSKN